MSEQTHAEEYIDDVPEILPGEREPAAAWAQVPVETHLDLPENGTPSHGLYMTHETKRLYGTAVTIEVIKKDGAALGAKAPKERPSGSETSARRAAAKSPGMHRIAKVSISTCA